MKGIKFLISGMFFFITLFSSAMAQAQPSLTTTSSIDEIRNELKNMDVYVLEISLEDGEFPTFDKIEAPEGCGGVSITNNNYVLGSLRIEYKGNEVYNSGEYNKKKSGIKVKVRGNSSSYADGVKKKSYKIKLEKKHDLLLRDSAGLEDKEWVLLGYASKFLHYVPGFEIGRQLGLGWQPEFRNVAVIMNDQYMGSYYLCEPVKGGKNRVDIDDTGYIVENDVYWWKPDETYFKTINQVSTTGWTFKEPDTDDFHEMSIENIKWVLNTVEQKIYAGEEVDEMIDYRSFASWLLAHDIMNNADPLGSNSFIIKRDFNSLSPFETKLEMGPLWDLDAAFTEESDDFAMIHRFIEHWFYKLWELPAFRQTYTDVWLEVRDSIKERCMEKMRQYIMDNPEINHLRTIDYNLHLVPIKYPTTEKEYENMDKWFDQRIPVLNKLILNEAGVEDINGSSQNDSINQNFGETRSINIDGRPANKDTKGMVISFDTNGKVTKVMK
ncbi:MAG: CotH kinase family protein [Muribaculaceae bacterium]|nr:CotH kinase family protein [Muribaculaceae bacterium]